MNPLLYIVKKSKYITVKEGYVDRIKVIKMVVTAGDEGKINYPSWIAWEILNWFPKKYRAVINFGGK